MYLQSFGSKLPLDRLLLHLDEVAHDVATDHDEADGDDETDGRKNLVLGDVLPNQLHHLDHLICDL